MESHSRAKKTKIFESWIERWQGKMHSIYPSPANQLQGEDIFSGQWQWERLPPYACITISKYQDRYRVKATYDNNISITRTAKVIESRLVLDGPLADYNFIGNVFKTIYIVDWNGTPRLLFESNVVSYNTVVLCVADSDSEIDRILLVKK
jgi:hypothetical protein